MSDRFDIMHCHMGAAMIPYSLLSRTPMIHTVHAALEYVDDIWVLNQYPDVPIIAISNYQIAAIPEDRRRNISVIYHGCEVDRYEPSYEPGKYLAFL
ncbi:MAG: glycosyltransferase family 4 protein, partial [SAR324 cluster bacterium]|nr:glycosyltransferase family 4 protein [SAR324 cluster bacterium]